MCSLDEKALEQLAKDLSEKFFDKPFVHTIVYNRRLRTTGGRYIPSEKLIEINPKYVKEASLDVVEGIIKHELCHYHLHLQGKDFRENSTEFLHLLEQVGAPKFCTPLPSMIKRLKYKCTKCGLEYIRQRRVNVQKYRCGRCRGKITFVS